MLCCLIIECEIIQRDILDQQVVLGPTSGLRCGGSNEHPLSYSVTSVIEVGGYTIDFLSSDRLFQSATSLSCSICKTNTHRLLLNFFYFNLNKIGNNTDNKNIKTLVPRF